MTEEPFKLRRELGLISGITIILGIMFGTGIFISPREVLYKAGSVWGALLVWLICGFFATLGALSYAELGTALAKSGGDYHYIHESYGPLPAFLYLWDAVIILIPSTNAIMALTFANNILKPFFPNCSGEWYSNKLLAAFTLCAVTFLNCYNVKLTTKVQNFFIATMFVAMFTIIISGIVWMSKGRFEYFENGWAGTETSISEWSIAFYTGIFAYTGWNYLNFMTEELHNPYKNLPRAIYLSLPTVTIIYLLVNVAYLSVLGPVGMKASEAIAADYVALAFSSLKWGMSVLVAIACLGGLSVHVMTSSRMCFAGARNGHMLELLGHISLKYYTPIPSLVFLLLLSLVMIIPDSLISLITYCSFVESFFTTLSCSAVLWLRWKKPNLPRPIKVQLWMPITFVVVTTLMMLAPVLSEPVAVLSGVFITLSGVPVYWLFIKKQPKIISKVSKATTIWCQKLFYTTIEDLDD